MRALVIGSVKQYPTETAAWKAVSTLRLDVYHHTSRPEGLPETFEQLVEHYRLIELDLEKESERKVVQTKQTYAVYLKARIVPRWGNYRLREIKAVAVERWLGSIDDLANGTKAKITRIMSEVFQHAILYGWLKDGPPHLRRPPEHQAEAGHGTSGSNRVPCAHVGVAAYDARHWHRGGDYRTAHQRSPGPEVDGHRLEDIAVGNYPVGRGRHCSGKSKTETSRGPVPIDELTTAGLLAWRRETCYAEPEDWVFASERVHGKMPPWADTLLDRFLQPAAKWAVITKWVGFHTFRHTYSTLLKANGEDVKVVQELMRHANISTTMNIYTEGPDFIVPTLGFSTTYKTPVAP